MDRAQFDGNIYIWTLTDKPTQVFRYNTSRNTIEETPYQGAFFSPTGDYYYKPSYEGSEFGLYRSMNNEEVTGLSAFLSSSWAMHVHPRKWLDNTTLLIPSPLPSDPGDFLYAIQSDAARKVPGHVIGFADQGTRLLILENGQIRERALLELEVVKPQRAVRER